MHVCCIHEYPPPPPPQIEQEMELILSRPSMLRTFTTEWRVKWVPAVLTYCKALKKKEILEILKKDPNSIGMMCTWWI